MQAPDTAAVEALITATAVFLRRFPPFDGMEDDALRDLAARLSLAYYPQGSTILSPSQGASDFLYIVRNGEVHLSNSRLGRGALTADTTLGAGECFSVGAVLEKRATGSHYVAAVDTFCYRLPAADVDWLLDRSARFREFSTAYLTSLLRESRRLLKMDFAGAGSEEHAMNRTLRSLVQRAPVTCSPTTPIRRALQAMHDSNVGSILVVAADGTLAGIFTRRDVLDRVVLAQRALDQPIETVMTPAPFALDAQASAYEAALLVAQRGIRHVPVIDSGRLLGVVTERDLFALQRSSTRNINRAIDAAARIEDLQQAARDIRQWVREMVAQGIAAEQLTEMATLLNDALTRRVLELERKRHALDGIEWAWLAFGSEGRFEQTISTDQDNGIIFADIPGRSADEARDRLLPFAQAANRALDACGFPLCAGGIMAGNPQWCLSAQEWQRQFAGWIANSDAQQLLNAAIFFDFRALHGADKLAHELRDRLFVLIAARPVFLRQLAQEALATQPPLGVLGGFVTGESAQRHSGLDLKKSAARLFVDAARVLGLAAATAHTNTAQRLRHAGRRLNMSEQEITSAVEAFYFIQTLRLRAQLKAGDGTPREAQNRVDPDRLNEIDRRILKESLREARRLQARLALDHQL